MGGTKSVARRQAQDTGLVLLLVHLRGWVVGVDLLAQLAGLCDQLQRRLVVNVRDEVVHRHSRTVAWGRSVKPNPRHLREACFELHHRRSKLGQCPILS